MALSVEKVYAEALFSLISEENGPVLAAHQTVLDELAVVADAFESAPELSKLLGAPTVSPAEKLGVLERVFKHAVSTYVFNLLTVMTNKSRASFLPRVAREYRRMFNDTFGFSEIIVTAPHPLTEAQRAAISAKMAKITGKKVNLKERLDKTLIGGVVVDYGTTRFDGSVKTRLEALRQDIAGIIA